jgi:hypothetical protein
MASNRNIDYVEIDRILNSMFTPFKKSMTDKYEGTSFNEVILSNKSDNILQNKH